MRPSFFVRGEMKTEGESVVPPKRISSKKSPSDCEGDSYNDVTLFLFCINIIFADLPFTYTFAEVLIFEGKTVFFERAVF